MRGTLTANCRRSVRPMATLVTGKLVSPESAPDQCEAAMSIETAPAGIRWASPPRAAGAAPPPGAPADATGSGLLLGPFGLPADFPLLPCAESAGRTSTTSGLHPSA